MKRSIGLGALLAIAVALAPAPAHELRAQQSELVGQVEGRPAAPGWVGLRFREARVGDSTRVLIYSVYPDSPAERAGLRPGDRVLRLNGVRASFPIIQSLSSRIQPGDPWAFTVGRGGEVVEVPLVAVPRPPRSEIVVGTLQSQLDSLRIRIEMQLDTLQVSGIGGLPNLRVHREGSPEPGENTVRFVVTASGVDDEVMRVAEQMMLLAPAAAAEAERVFAFRADRLATTAEASADRRPSIAEEEARRARAERSAASGRTAPSSVGATTVWSGSAPFSPYPTGADRAAGAQFRRVVPDLGRYLGVTRGLLVVDVSPGTPAAKSGLRSGDVVLAVDGEVVESLAEFRNAISLPAASYALEIVRRGEPVRLDLRH